MLGAVHDCALGGDHGSWAQEHLVCMGTVALNPGWRVSVLRGSSSKARRSYGSQQLQQLESTSVKTLGDLCGGIQGLSFIAKGC